jgi:hypothetical protein
MIFFMLRLPILFCEVLQQDSILVRVGPKVHKSFCFLQQVLPPPYADLALGPRPQVRLSGHRFIPRSTIRAELTPRQWLMDFDNDRPVFQSVVEIDVVRRSNWAVRELGISSFAGFEK